MQLAKHMGKFYRLLVELMKSENFEVRKALTDVFSDCITPLLQLPGDSSVETLPEEMFSS